jgi:hypothetical protein
MSDSWSHRRKLARADRHIDEVETMISELAKDGYRVCEQSHGEGRSLVYAELLKPLPDQIPLAIGDALHCQRASLDHLVFALAKRNRGILTDKQEKKTEFPILDRAVTTENSAIRHVHYTVRLAICDLAPDPNREPLNKHPLWLLHKVENRDKHREIPIVVSSAYDAWRVTARPSEYFIDYGPVVLQLGVGPQLICECDATDDVGIRPEITFDKGTEFEGRPVVRSLRNLSEHIRGTVFQRLEPHLAYQP